MSTENLIELVGELAEVIKNHKLDTVDSEAAKLLKQVQLVKHAAIDSDSKNMDVWFEEMRIANLCNTTR